VLLSASDILSKLRGVPGPAPILTGDIPVSSVNEPLPPQHDAASANKKNTGRQTVPISTLIMQQSMKEEEKCERNGPTEKRPAMRGTNGEVEVANSKSKEKMISNMSKTTIMQAHHGTKNKSGNKEAILA